MKKKKKTKNKQAFRLGCEICGSPYKSIATNFCYRCSKRVQKQYEKILADAWDIAIHAVKSSSRNYKRG